jgi:hypothetical protein
MSQEKRNDDKCCIDESAYNFRNSRCFWQRKVLIMENTSEQLKFGVQRKNNAYHNVNRFKIKTSMHEF